MQIDDIFESWTEEPAMQEIANRILTLGIFLTQFATRKRKGENEMCRNDRRRNKRIGFYVDIFCEKPVD